MFFFHNPCITELMVTSFLTNTNLSHIFFSANQNLLFGKSQSVRLTRDFLPFHKTNFSPEPKPEEA